MLNRSISRTDAAPSAHASARSWILPTSLCRSCAVRALESSTPRIARMSGGMMTAHATTGPAMGPRPPSSTPARRGPRSARRSLSMCVQRFSRYGARPFAVGLFEPSSATPLQPVEPLCLGARNLHARLALLDARCLSGEMAQVIQLCAAYAATTDNRDTGDHRAVHGENALDADSARDLPDRERLADT